jgi:toxin YoeB
LPWVDGLATRVEGSTVPQTGRLLLVHILNGTGIGKPEPLRHTLAGYWSRRITDEHRFVHRVAGNELRIAQLRYHYER